MLLPAGTYVQLTIRLPISAMLAACFLLCVFAAACWLVWQTSHSIRSLAVSLGITGSFMLVFMASAWGSMRRAERYFQQALLLSKDAE